MMPIAHMPDVDLPHERIRLSHHPQGSDDQEPDHQPEERRIERQNHEYEDDGHKSRQEQELPISAHKKVGSR